MVYLDQFLMFKSLRIPIMKTLLDSFYVFWEIKSERVHILKLESIIFTYKIVPLDNKGWSLIKKTKISSHPNIKVVTVQINLEVTI